MPGLREAIAHHVAFARAVACAADDVVVTSGAQQAMDLLARLLVTPGQTGLRSRSRAIRRSGPPLPPPARNWCRLPVDEEGLCVERLPADVRIIASRPRISRRPASSCRCAAAPPCCDFARRHDAVVIEDDYDGEFRFGGRPLDALQTLDRDGRVFYVGTFSKSMFPSLRKGFVVAPAWAREPLVTIKHCTDSHCDTITQSVLAAFIQDGHLARHVRHMRPIYAERREALLDGLRGELAPWLEPIPSEAGLHLAARIREPERAPRILPTVLRFAPGAESTADYAMTSEIAPAVTFGYGVIDAQAISTALKDMRRALEKGGRFPADAGPGLPPSG